MKDTLYNSPEFLPDSGGIRLLPARCPSLCRSSHLVPHNNIFNDANSHLLRGRTRRALDSCLTRRVSYLTLLDTIPNIHCVSIASNPRDSFMILIGLQQEVMNSPSDMDFTRGTTYVFPTEIGSNIIVAYLDLWTEYTSRATTVHALEGISSLSNGSMR